MDLELPDADVEVEGGSDGEEEFGASILMCFLRTIIPENDTYVLNLLISLCVLYIKMTRNRISNLKRRRNTRNFMSHDTSCNL